MEAGFPDSPLPPRGRPYFGVRVKGSWIGYGRRREEVTMSSPQIVLIVLILVVIAAGAAFAVAYARRQGLKQRFGDEYQHLVAETNSKSAAEKELRGRERRHAELQLRALTPEARDAYATRWQDVQALFVDEPEEAVNQADALVTEIAGDIGYPTENDADKEAQLSVDHGRTLSAYRRAREIGERARNHEADVDELRQAVVDYRELVAALLGTSPVPSAASEATPAPDHTPSDERATTPDV